MTNGSLMKVESIGECSIGAFCNSFDLHLAIISLQSKEEGKDQESIQSNRTSLGKVTKTQEISHTKEPRVQAFHSR